jgi:hypothetical protein
MFVALYDVMSTVGIAANVRCLPRWLHSCSWQGWLLEIMHHLLLSDGAT